MCAVACPVVVPCAGTAWTRPPGRARAATAFCDDAANAWRPDNLVAASLGLEDELVSITVRPASAQRWQDVAGVFAGRGGSSCWCQRFRRTSGSDKSTALHGEIDEAGAPVGLIAYVDGEPVGWSRVMPRISIPGVAENQALRRLYARDEADPAWWISCFAVRRPYRGSGVGVSLLRSATQFARGRGAAVLDGHPVDVERLSRRPSPSAVFTGTLSMFTAAGFHEIGRTFPSRPVMRHDLHDVD